MPSAMASGAVPPGAGAAALASEEAYAKVRKPYTITKTRESWTEQEHDRFLEALQLFDRDWKKIEAFVGSKTVIQIRSHAQKYFLKVQKNGTGEHVPPPRPKRKSAQPYPQKASKFANIQQCFTALPLSAAGQSDSGYASGSTCTGFVPPVATNSMTSSWIHHTSNADLVVKDLDVVNASVGNHSSSSEGSSSANCQQQGLPSSKGGQNSHNQAVPDFAEIYKFLANVFDPGVADHSKKLKEMDPIDRETVLLLMRNLCMNLSSPEFEEHKFFLSMYDANSMQSSMVTAGIQESSHLDGSVSHSCMEQLNGTFVPASKASCSSAIEASVGPQHQVQLTGTPLGLAEFVQSPQLSCNDFQTNGIMNVHTPFVPLPAPSSLLGRNTAISPVGWLANGQGAVIQLG